MTNEGKRFVVILVCTFIGFVVLDVVVKCARNALVDWRIDHVRIGISEAEAIRITGEYPFDASNGGRKIVVKDRSGVLDLIVGQNSYVVRTILLDGGKVVAVQKRRNEVNGCIIFSEGIGSTEQSSTTNSMPSAESGQGVQGKWR